MIHFSNSFFDDEGNLVFVYKKGSTEIMLGESALLGGCLLVILA